MKDESADILSEVRSCFGTTPPNRIGIALSGGGDSVALMHILHEAFQNKDVTLCAATVDHGLRPEAGAEIRQAAAQAKALGIRHSVLTWEGWDSSGNLQDQARRARYRLLTDWAKSREIAVLALGHTADDQAETVLMRLARASGVNGLSAMPLRRTFFGVTVTRPLLGQTRQRLRNYLVSRNIPWSDDPSNQDESFDRIKARRALAELAPLGLTAETLAEVATNMSKAREALDWYTFLAARDFAHVDGGDVLIRLRQYRTLPEEIARRLLVRSLVWVGGANYPPRRAAVRDLIEAIRESRTATLAGCQVMPGDGYFRVCREYQAVREEVSEPGLTWDKRWIVYGGEMSGTVIRPLGKHGLKQCDNWRETGRPYAALMATPGVWRGERLLAAPLAGRPEGWHAELIGGGEEFFASLLSH